MEFTGRYIPSSIGLTRLFGFLSLIGLVTPISIFARNIPPPGVGALQASRLILIDENTGERHCLRMRYGSMYISPGDCTSSEERRLDIVTPISPVTPTVPLEQSSPSGGESSSPEGGSGGNGGGNESGNGNNGGGNEGGGSNNGNGGGGGNSNEGEGNGKDKGKSKGKDKGASAIENISGFFVDFFIKDFFKWIASLVNL